MQSSSRQQICGNKASLWTSIACLFQCSYHLDQNLLSWHFVKMLHFCLAFFGLQSYTYKQQSFYTYKQQTFSSGGCSLIPDKTKAMLASCMHMAIWKITIEKNRLISQGWMRQGAPFNVKRCPCWVWCAMQQDAQNANFQQLRQQCLRSRLPCRHG